VHACSQLLSNLQGIIDLEASLEQRKTVDLLLQSCYAARLLNGARMTSCKSAKDRTSMFHTLELVQLAEKRGMLAALKSLNDRWEEQPRRNKGQEMGTVQNVLNLLRGVNGVRLQNCKDNIGRPKFSFNAMQVKALPRELRPPLWTIGGGSKA
jgi:inositol polyphosphate-4-phosphatase